jgi:phosphoglycerol transferase MdoB-like AlkP superfamily enzyme
MTGKILAGVFGLATLAAGGMTVMTWSVPPAGGWLFLIFTLLFAFLTWSAARPVKPPEPRPVRFVPSWFFELAILIVVGLSIIVTISLILRKR